MRKEYRPIIFFPNDLSYEIFFRVCCFFPVSLLFYLLVMDIWLVCGGHFINIHAHFNFFSLSSKWIFRLHLFIYIECASVFSFSISALFILRCIVDTVSGWYPGLERNMQPWNISIIMRVNAHSHKNLWITHYNKSAKWASFIRLWQFAWVAWVRWCMCVFTVHLHCYNHRPFKWPDYYQNAAALQSYQLPSFFFLSFLPMKLLFIFQSTIEINTHKANINLINLMSVCWIVRFIFCCCWFNS